MMGAPVSELKALFKSKGMSQRAVAERAGVSQQAISRWLTGRDTPTAANQRRLAAALGVSPRDLREVTGWPANESAADVLAPPPVNAPEPLSSFVGRGDMLNRLHECLAPNADAPRLVVLTGSPGVGKTRVARRIAALLTDDYGPGQVSYLSFAATDMPDALEQDAVTTVSRALGSVVGVETAKPGDGEPRSSSPRLLVLDAFEQVLEARRLLNPLLTANPDLRILIVSRVLPGAGDKQLHLGPMTTPVLPAEINRIGAPAERQRRVAAWFAEDNGAAVRGMEAVQLFTDRARLVWPDFTVDRTNAAAVIDLVNWLQGLPLAIETVAARGRYFGGPRELLEHVRQSSTNGSAHAPGATNEILAHAIVDSHRALSEEQRVVFRRLAVFADSFAITPAIEMLARHRALSTNSDPAAEPDLAFANDMQEILFSLIDASLVGVERSPGGASRYRILSPVRDLGLRKLAEAGETDLARRAHAETFREFAQRAEAEFLGPDLRFWLDQLESEIENLRAALGWSLVHAREDINQPLIAALWWFWEVRGYFEEGATWLQRLIAAIPADALDPLTLLGAGVMALRRGNLDESHRALSLAVERFEQQERQVGEALAVSYLAVVAEIRQHDDEAEALMRRGLALAENVRNWYVVSGSLGNLGELAMRQGNYGEARQKFDAALMVARARGIDYNAARAQNNLGRLALREGNQQSALDHFLEGLRLSWSLHDMRGLAIGLESLGAATAFEDPERAAVLFGAAAGWRDTLGAPLQADYQPDQLAGEERARTALGNARFDELALVGRETPLARVIAEALAPRATPGELLVR